MTANATPEREYTDAELMITNAARELGGEHVVFVGVGIPTIAAILAKRTVSPQMNMIYEAGIFGPQPRRLPLSIADPCLVTGAKMICGMPDLFFYYLQGGHVDVGMLGGAQVDRYGNINSTVIGKYDSPKVRLPGSGGACEIAQLAKKTIIVTPMEKRRLPQTVDFITTTGFLGGSQEREQLQVTGHGPVAVVTNIGILRPNPGTREMQLAALHPGTTVEQARVHVGWDLQVAADLIVTDPPTAEELAIIRDLDPKGIFRI